MDFKKYILIVVFFGLIPFPYCKPEYPYYSIRRMTLDLYKDVNLKNEITSGDGITTDSVFIKINFITQYTAQIINFNFGNKLCATTKPGNGAFGLKGGLKAINFTSNNIFNGRPPGTNLNDIVNWIDYNGYKSLDDLMGALSGGSIGYFSDPVDAATEKLYISQRPSDGLNHSFKLELIFKSGAILSAQVIVIWK